MMGVLLRRVRTKIAPTPQAELWIGSYFERGQGGWGYFLNFGRPPKPYQAYGKIINTDEKRVLLFSLLKGLSHLGVESTLVVRSTDPNVVNTLQTGRFNSNTDLWMKIFALTCRHSVTAGFPTQANFIPIVNERCKEWGLNHYDYEEDQWFVREKVAVQTVMEKAM